MPDVPVNHTGQPIFATAGMHRGALNALARKGDAAFWQNNGKTTAKQRQSDPEVEMGKGGAICAGVRYLESACVLADFSGRHKKTGPSRVGKDL